MTNDNTKRRVMLFGAVYFDLLTEQYQAVTMIDNLIEGLKTARKLAAKNELRIGVAGLIENEHDDSNLGIGGNLCVDTRDVYFLKRFEAIELDGNWHILDHKHPQFLSPPCQDEAGAKRTVDVWNAPPSL